ncbi:MAG: hypothetical protein K0U15_00965 [Proteobacteria bacterium]|nr:hypothetical protein [Pseudomonadota bacterium]
MRGLKDISLFQQTLKKIPIEWEGKQCVHELKKFNYHWEQAEWQNFYFRYKFMQSVYCEQTQIPGDKYGKDVFDVKGEINWELNVATLKTDFCTVTLSNTATIHKAIAEHGYHGEVIALCNFAYDDNNRSFQSWHENLKGESFALDEIPTHCKYRKVRASVHTVVFLILKEEDLAKLPTVQGEVESDGKRGAVRYRLNFENTEQFYCKVINLL